MLDESLEEVVRFMDSVDSYVIFSPAKSNIIHDICHIACSKKLHLFPINILNEIYSSNSIILALFGRFDDQ